MTSGDVEQRTGKARSPRWTSLLRLALVLLLVGAVVYAVVRQWADVRLLLAELTWDAVAVAVVAVLAGIYATFLAWRAILTDLGFRLSLPAGMRLFFVSQLGKYVPGKVWPLVVQMRLGRAQGVPQRASGAAVAVFLLMVIGTGLVVAVPALPLLGGAAWSGYWWIALVLVLVVVVMVPRVLNGLIAVALRLARREPLPRPLAARGVAVAGAWSLVAWLAYGVHVWALAVALGAEPSLWLYAVATGSFAAAFSAGFLVPITPAGAGAREVALILLLGVALAQAQATAIALVSRLLFTALDAAWAGVALLFRAVWPRQSSTGTDGSPPGRSR